MDASFDDLLHQFIKSRYDENTSKVLVDQILSLREQIEQQGRLYELREMVKYHQKMADHAKTKDEKNTHIADIVVLEARISYLENPRDTPPVTTEE